MSLTAGTRLGPYEVLGPLGAGGMGEVYKARDTRLNRIVAIKTMRGQFGERFEREARAVSALNHPHICALFDVGEAMPELPPGAAPVHDAGWPADVAVRYLVMEYVEGASPAGPMPIAVALRYATEIASALEAAHLAGVIHRDLKPANILITKRGVKLLDFGLAKLPDGVDSTAGLTEPFMVMGTPQYMSPEQIQGQKIDARSDIFSFGCVLYEFLTGRKPFAAMSPVNLMNAIVSMAPAPMQLPPSALASAVEPLVMRCLAKGPAARWQTAGELGAALTSIASTPTHDLEPAPRPPSPRIFLSRRATIAVAVVGVLAMTAIALALRYFSDSSPSRIGGSSVQKNTLSFAVQAGPGSRRDAAADRFALSPDGSALAFDARRADGIPTIWTRRFNVAAAAPLAGSDGGAQPFWSPDGRAIGFVRGGSIIAVDVASGQSRQVCELPAGAHGLGGTWAPGVIVFALADRGLFSVKDKGGAPVFLAGSGADSQHASLRWPSFLPDGRRLLAYAKSGIGGAAVYVASLDGGAAVRLVQSAGASAYVEGSLIYSRAAIGRYDLVQSPLDLDRLRVGRAVRVVQQSLAAPTDGGAGFSVANGTFAVQRAGQVKHQLAWMDRGGRDLEPIGRDAAIEEFALAPDGQRVVATIRDPSTGTADLWLIDTKRGEVVRLTHGGAERPLWARNGRQVYFSSPDDGSGHVVEIEAAIESPLTLLGPPSHFEDLTRDGRYFVLKTIAEPSEIWLQKTDDPGEHRTLVKEPIAATSARVSPNGRWLAFTLSQGATHDVFVQPFDRPGNRVRVADNGGANPVWRDDSRELFYEAADALMAVSVTDDRGVPALSPPARALSLHTQGVVRTQPHNVEVSGRGPRFLVNTIVGDSDNVPIDVTLNAGLTGR